MEASPPEKEPHRKFQTLEALRDYHQQANREALERFRARAVDCENKSFNWMIIGFFTGTGLSFTAMNMLARRYPMFGQGRGSGLVIGSMGSLMAYVVGRYTYRTSIENYLRDMRIAAEKRHDHYFEQLLKAPPQATPISPESDLQQE